MVLLVLGSKTELKGTLGIGFRILRNKISKLSKNIFGLVFPVLTQKKSFQKTKTFLLFV